MTHDELVAALVKPGQYIIADLTPRNAESQHRKAVIPLPKRTIHKRGRDQTRGQTMTSFVCTLCGSITWPDPHTSCPLCYGDDRPDEQHEHTEQVEHDDDE